MNDNASKAIIIAVFIFVTLAIVTAVGLMFSAGKDLASSMGSTEDIAGNTELSEYEVTQYMNKKVTGADVKSAIYKYKENKKVQVNIVTNGVGKSIDNINNSSSIINSSGVVETSKLEEYVNSTAAYSARVSRAGDIAIITFELGGSISTGDSDISRTNAPILTATFPQPRVYRNGKYQVNITVNEGYKHYNISITNSKGITIKNSNERVFSVDLACDDYVIKAVAITKDNQTTDTAFASNVTGKNIFRVSNNPPNKPILKCEPQMSGSNNIVFPGIPIWFGADKTNPNPADPDGDPVTYRYNGGIHEGYNSFYNSVHTVSVTAIDSAGLETTSDPITFSSEKTTFMSSLILTGPNSTILSKIIVGATIKSYRFTVPPVSGHSGRDYGRIRARVKGTDTWEQIDYGGTSNGITLSKSTANGGFAKGRYDQLELYYYTNHSCMYNKSNITCSVEYE